MSEDRRHSLTERVTVNFSPAQLERLEKYLQRYSENLGGFIRRAALEKLDQLGVPAEKEGLGDLLDEAGATSREDLPSSRKCNTRRLVARVLCRFLRDGFARPVHNLGHNHDVASKGVTPSRDSQADPLLPFQAAVV